MAAEIVTDMGAQNLVEEQGPAAAPQEREEVEAAAAAATRGRVLGRDSVFSRPPAGRYISPMPREASGEQGGLGIVGFRGTLTPAAFKGLTSGMRTPTVEVKPTDGFTEKVRAGSG